MKKAIVILVVLIAVTAVIAGGWWHLNQNPEVLSLAEEELNAAVQELVLEREEPPPGLVASGFIEADEASVTTELGGRIIALHADEGDSASLGMPLVELDSALLQAQIEVAEAELAVAEAALAQVKAGVRQETIDRALAQLDQSKAAQQAAAKIVTSSLTPEAQRKLVDEYIATLPEVQQ